MKGFSLIDVLVGSTLSLIFFLGVFGLYELGLKISHQNQHRTVAAGIANEYMEQTRTLVYGNVGVVGGFPSGIFRPLETIFRNNHPYEVLIRVHYVADPADGIGHPQDRCPNDYKRVMVSVRWVAPFSGNVAMATNVAPASELEECGSVGGILRINIVNPFGQPVPNATVSVNDINTPLSVLCITGLDGLCQFILPTSPVAQGNNYAVLVSKSGWSQARTFRPGDMHYGLVITNPIAPHFNLLSGRITESTFSIGQLSSFNIRTVSFRQPEIPIGFVGLTIRGSEIVGWDANEAPIFRYNQAHTTNSGGMLSVTGLRWDNYRFTATGLTIRDPEGDISLGAGINREVVLRLESDHSLLVNVGGSDERTPLFSASVRVFRGTFERVLLTDQGGRVLFIPLEEGTYQVEVSKEGYTPFVGQILVRGNITKNVNLVLNPN